VPTAGFVLLVLLGSHRAELELGFRNGIAHYILRTITSMAHASGSNSPCITIQFGGLEFGILLVAVDLEGFIAEG
jgi:hypothetical protein